MGKVVQFFIDRKMFIDILLIVIIILGVGSVVKSRKEGFPEISLNKLIVQTIYPGASAKDVEINVTMKIEEELKEVEGIKEILSYSEESISRIEVQGLENLKPTQFRRLFTDVENAISRIDDFPTNLKGKPTVTEITTSDVPILELAYTGEYKILKPYLEDLKLRLRKLPGVSGVDVVGLPDEEVHIYIDPQKARQNFLDLRAIANSIRYRNTEGSGGIIETNQGERKIVLTGKFKNYEDVLETDLLTNEMGYRIKLKDVATLDVVPEDLKLLVRNNGERGSIITIRKIGSADLLNTVDSIEALLFKEKLPKGVTYRKLFDQSILTRDRINLLIGNSIMGFILVLLVLLYFLNFHTAFWTAAGIPVALLGMLIFLKLMDISINLISLAGFIIIIGMLVDDAVVVAEEYNTNRENEMQPGEAAVSAIRRIWAPILASSLTTMIAFAPLFMVGGFPGAFIWTIPLMVIVGLSISLLESFVMLPSHLVNGKSKKHTDKKLMIFLENSYRTTLKIALKNRYKVFLLFLVSLIVSMVILKKIVKKEPFPQDAAEGFSISLTLPLGLTALESEQQLKKVEQLLSKLPKEELLGFSNRIGTQSELTYNDRGNQNNLAILFVYLTPYQERTRTANQIIESLKGELNLLSQKMNFEYSIYLKRIGPPMGRDIEVRVISNNDELRFNKMDEIQKFLMNTNGVYNVETDKREGVKEIAMNLDYSMLSITGLTGEDVLNSIRIALDGLIVTDMSSSERQVNFRLKLNNKICGDATSLQELQMVNSQRVLPIKNQQGNLINMKQLVSLNERTAEATIHHIDSVRSNTILANINNKIISPTEVMDLIKNKFPSDSKIQIDFSGQPVETNLIFSGLTSAAGVALLGVYLMIALIFNSYTRPIVIMLSLPFMAIGLAFVLLTHGIPGSMMVGIAIVGLMGVVVNASIVLVDTITNLSESNKITMDMIIEGSVSRLRPIVLTTATTVLGVLPTGYGIGGFDPFLSHMSLVLAYGLLFATAIILILVPVLLMIGQSLLKTTKN